LLRSITRLVVASSFLVAALLAAVITVAPPWGDDPAIAGSGPVIRFKNAPFSEPVTDPPQVIKLEAVVTNAINAYSVKVDYDETIIDVTMVNNIYAVPGTELCPAENPDLDLGGGNMGFEITCGGTGAGGSTGTFDLADVTFDCLGAGTANLIFTAAEVSENFIVVPATGINTTITCTGPPTNTPLPTATHTPTPTATNTPTILTPTHTPTTVPDTDGDGLDNNVEQLLGTNPNDPDTDDDGLSDGVEVNTTLTDPLDPDTDNDTLSDGVETDTGTYISPTNTGTDPHIADTDGDLLSDGVETNTSVYVSPTDTGTHPLVADTDGDGIRDGVEVNTFGTNPLLADTDGDVLNDAQEILLGSDPQDPDTDGDGLPDGDEVFLHGTEPLLPDTDGDGLNDGVEVGLGTDPTDNDTDNDGLQDGQEVNTYGTDPLDDDSDDDGASDGGEVVTHGTDPFDPDTEDDGMPDGFEIVNTCLDPLVNDTALDPDLDAVTNIGELGQSTLPCNPDTDADGFKDKPSTTQLRNNANAAVDNCILAFNPPQLNSDGEPIPLPGPSTDETHPNADSLGDACDNDDDNDGINDLAEATGTSCSGVLTAGLIRDTDGDGVNDGYECSHATNPTNAASRPVIASSPDGDGDKLQNLSEQAGYGTNIAATDTDGDGCSDAIETISIDNNKNVGFMDFSLLLSKWNMAGLADWDVSGKVGFSDFVLMLIHWNMSC
jgi:hypothetical protein